MNEQQLRQLYGVFQRAQVAWYFRSSGDFGGRTLEADMEAVEAELRRRYGAQATPNILDYCMKDTDAALPFVQTFAMAMSTPMRAAAYRIVEGDIVRRVEFSYELEATFRVVVTLEDTQGALQEFESTQLGDIEIIRNLGSMEVGEGRPVLTGLHTIRYPD